MTRESGSGGSRVTRTECEGGLESSGSDLRFRFVFELTGGSYLRERSSSLYNRGCAGGLGEGSATDRRRIGEGSEAVHRGFTEPVNFR
jgi:hypothetical protein